MLGIGKVSSINAVNGTAQVVFEDKSGKVSGDLPVIVPFTLSDKAYYMPSVGERVVVIFDDGAPSKGYIIGSYYADTRLPPDGNAGKTYVNFADGTRIEYDKSAHKLNVTGAELSVAIACKGDVNISSLEGNVVISGKNAPGIF